MAKYYGESRLYYYKDVDSFAFHNMIQNILLPALPGSEYRKESGHDEEGRLIICFDIYNIKGKKYSAKIDIIFNFGIMLDMCCQEELLLCRLFRDAEEILGLVRLKPIDKSHSIL